MATNLPTTNLSRVAILLFSLQGVSFFVFSGDKLIVFAEAGESPIFTSVEKIETVYLEGIFAPFTLAGSIVVDGCLASCYASVGSLGFMSGHDIAHVATAPLRLAHRLGLGSLLQLSEDSDISQPIELMYKLGKKLRLAA